jgi:hypothetical protein
MRRTKEVINKLVGLALSNLDKGIQIGYMGNISDNFY